jgi:hypothetical protein
MTTYVAPIGSGLGDVLISLPVIDSLIDRGEDVCLVTRSFRQLDISSRIAGIKGELPEERLHLTDGDRYVNLRDHPLQTEHIWGSSEFEEWFGPTNYEKIIALIAQDFGIAVTYERLRPLDFNFRPDIADKIVFVPGTDGYYKHWITEYWLKLKSALLASSIEAIVVGKLDESPAVKDLWAHGLPWVETPTPGEAIDVVSSCRAVVAVDTGLMHVALQQGIPTIAFIHPRNYHFRSVKNCSNLFGIACPAKCERGELATPTEALAASALDVTLKFDHRPCTLPASESCMGAIQPATVVQLLREKGVIAD